MDEEPDVRKISKGSQLPGQDVCMLNAHILAIVPA